MRDSYIFSCFYDFIRYEYVNLCGGNLFFENVLLFHGLFIVMFIDPI